MYPGTLFTRFMRIRGPASRGSASGRICAMTICAYETERPFIAGRSGPAIHIPAGTISSSPVRRNRLADLSDGAPSSTPVSPAMTSEIVFPAGRPSFSADHPPGRNPAYRYSLNPFSGLPIISRTEDTRPPCVLIPAGRTRAAPVPVIATPSRAMGRGPRYYQIRFYVKRPGLRRAAPRRMPR